MLPPVSWRVSAAPPCFAWLLRHLPSAESVYVPSGGSGEGLGITGLPPPSPPEVLSAISSPSAELPLKLGAASPSCRERHLSASVPLGVFAP